MTIRFCTVLPHEPLPHPTPNPRGCSSSSNNTNGSQHNFSHGYIHLQGAFLPKRKEHDAKITSSSKPLKRNYSLDGGSCRCCDAEVIESVLLKNMQQLAAKMGISEKDAIISADALFDSTDCEHGRSIDDNNNINENDRNVNNNSISLSKVRITCQTPAQARTLTCRLRRWLITPRDLMLPSIGDGGNTIGNSEGLCPHGCGGRYNGRPLQVCQVTPMEEAAENEVEGRGHCGNELNLALDERETKRWARASPPKFRRLISTVDSGNSNYSIPSYHATCGAFDNGEELEYRRGTTRFVFMENVLGGAFSLDDVNVYLNESHASLDEDVVRCIREGLVDIFRGKIVSQANKGDEHENINTDHLARHDVEDDIRHAFQEALRLELSQFDTSANQDGVELFLKSDTTIGQKQKGKSKKETDGSFNADNGKGGTSAQSVGLYEHLHLGMRSNDDARRLIQSWQGKRVTLAMELPLSFLSEYNSGKPSNFSHQMKASITTGKLFLDYADILLPKGRSKVGVPRKASNSTSLASTTDSNVKLRGEPSRSECTSTTSHVHIPGLILQKDFVTEKEEQIIMAVLTGPHAPWAPPQFTPSGGMIRRRVQHYGYVFDYESADVLRRDGANGKRHSGSDCQVEEDPSACPPLPAIDFENVEGMSNEEVENWISKAVEDVKGWEALAGIIERTRRVDFTLFAENDSLASEDITEIGVVDKVEKLSIDDHENKQGNRKSIDNTSDRTEKNHSARTRSPSKGTYPNINQLTVNEYNPGQGIGSHVDTETAFDDGLLIITLNGGIVMEFRKVSDLEDEAPGSQKDGRKLVYLPPRSLVLLSRDARYNWEHMIVNRTTDTVNGNIIPRDLRVSLTLRTALTAPQANEIAGPLPRVESTIFPPRWGQIPETSACSNREMGISTHSSATDRSDLITPETESKHVHAVYDAIATQWHHTRGKRGVLWPGATQFLENLPPGSIVADIGCGDGKYFSSIIGCGSYVIGTDISLPLLKTASSGSGGEGGPQHQQLSIEKETLSTRPAVAVADCIHLPLRTGSCDAAICIAVMHHLSTVGRRIRCIAELARVVKVGGVINIQAWALEQENDSKRKFHGTDVLVPFNAQPKYLQAVNNHEGNGTPSKDAPAVDAKGKGVAQMLSENYDGAEFDSKKNLVIFQRYCHMYRQGELEELVAEVPGLELMESAYEKGNHVVLVAVREHFDL
mmetsp:Transcript_8770/g.18365  ORF Transcript_8770/g.18365 Transcript_8770/m.18365 type:complete len:1203 (-) Transcript_8770:113-3721(-)